METNNSLSFVWKSSLVWWVIVGVSAVLAGYAFLETIQDMIYRWDTKEEYGYGYLIPVISIFLIWQRKNQLAEMEFHPSLAGLLLVVLGGVIFFLGAVAPLFH